MSTDDTFKYHIVFKQEPYSDSEETAGENTSSTSVTVKIEVEEEPREEVKETNIGQDESFLKLETERPKHQNVQAISKNENNLHEHDITGVPNPCGDASSLCPGFTIKVEVDCSEVQIKEELGQDSIKTEKSGQDKLSIKSQEGSQLKVLNDNTEAPRTSGSENHNSNKITKLKNDNKGQVYSCKVCYKHFISMDNLLMHIYRNQGSPLKCKKKRTRPNIFYYCANCDNKYSYKQHLIRHMKTHFYCKYCSKTFVTTTDLQEHLLMHVEYKCKFCSKIFEDGGTLEEHLKNLHGEKPYICKVCTASFARKYGLEEHMRSHSDNRPFSCQDCNKRFKSKQKLTDHQFIHIEGKTVQCDICQAFFKTRIRLRDHMTRAHPGRKYQCEICQKEYTNLHRLSTHRGTHFNVPPYTCTVCQKEFKYKQNLTTHLRIHTGERPYTCQFCPKTFSVASNLYAHVRNVHSKQK